MIKLNLSLLFLLLLIFSSTTAQVAVNMDGGNPNTNAILDIESSTMGLLIPRMTTAERTSFETTLGVPEAGMLIFDTDIVSFFFFDGTAFTIIREGVISGLVDGDGDTKIEVERTADDDLIYYTLAGTDHFKMIGGRLEVLNTGSSIFIGENAGENDDLSDNYNVFIGSQAGQANTTGLYNTAIGYHTLYANTTGNFNTAFGTDALKANSIGHNNTSLGVNSMTFNTEGTHNAAFGKSSLYKNTTGRNNTALGSGSLFNNTTGEENTAMGFSALFNNLSGHNNIAIGAQALYTNTASGFLIAIRNCERAT